MSFLQPWMLAALPLIAIPVIIHLINQRRYQTTHWAAMMFLLAATRMSRGYARIRQWLILLFRTLVIAGLVFAVSRPLSSGWLGLAAGSRGEMTLLLLDRSPSMQLRETASDQGKLQRGTGQLVDTLRMLGSSRWGLIDSTGADPQELESIESLFDSSSVTPAGNSADLPSMLAAARDYIRANQPGHTDIWIVSDLQAADWDPDSSRWQTLRDDFQSFPQGIRFHLLAMPEPANENLAIRVTDAKRVETSERSELLLSLRLTGQGDSNQRQEVPVVVEIEGTRSVVPVEWVGSETELKDYRIALPRGQQRGWGRVSIPADANPSDNTFYFVFDNLPPHKTAIVSESTETAELLRLAATAGPDSKRVATADVFAATQIATIPWEEISLLLWQGGFPAAEAADNVKSFLARGGRAIFFPSPITENEDFLGVRWGGWIGDAENDRIETWRGDQDLLANTASGAALPVGQLQLRQRIEMSGEFTALATLADDQPLLGSVLHGDGAAYFLATTPAGKHSSLASDGVVFYVMVQRALQAGSEALGNTRQLDAGTVASGEDWQQLVGAEGVLSSEYPFQPGVYAAGDRWLAVNRPLQEDDPARVPDGRLEALFGDLDFIRVDAEAGSSGGLVSEIWRLFVIAMISAMIIEAGLSLPNRGREG